MINRTRANIYAFGLVLSAVTARSELAMGELTNAGPPPQSRVLLAVTAHPDDEVFMGPTLTRYASEAMSRLARI